MHTNECQINGIARYSCDVKNSYIAMSTTNTSIYTYLRERFYTNTHEHIPFPFLLPEAGRPLRWGEFGVEDEAAVS